MAVFPAAPLPAYPVAIEPEWGTLVSEFDSGAEMRRQLWTFPKYNATLRYEALSAANQQILWAFYMARKGAFEPFWFFDPAPAIGIVTSHTGQYVGVGNGSTRAFDLPGSSTSSRSVYFNGAVQSSGFTYGTGTGDGGADQVTFTVAPSAGVLITANFTGTLRMRVRFAADKLSRELFMTVLFNYGLALKGLGPV